MPAHDIEVEEALEEGVTMRWLSTVAQAEAGKLVIEKMKLDETGFPQPTGEFEELEADCLVLALGQNADLSVLQNVPGATFSDNVVEVGPDLMTGTRASSPAATWCRRSHRQLRNRLRLLQGLRPVRRRMPRRRHRDGARAFQGGQAGLMRRPVTRFGTIRRNSSRSPAGQGSTPACSALARASSDSTW